MFWLLNYVLMLNWIIYTGTYRSNGQSVIHSGSRRAVNERPVENVSSKKLFHRSLSDIRSLTDLLSILSGLNKTVVWIVSSLLISNSSSPLSKSFGTILMVPITYGITLRLIFYTVSDFLAMYTYLSIFLFSFIFNLLSTGTIKYARL